MKLSLLSLALATAGVLAQRPSNESICDYYTNALLGSNNATAQYTVLTLVVNTAVIGNYTQPNVGIAVPGILAEGTYMNQTVNLAPYFTGELASTNRNGTSGVSVNFLDGGGAAPLLQNMPANDNTSNQYFLLTHLYSYFGSLLNCSTYGEMDFPAYMGQASQFNVHKFMVLDQYQVGYFIEQVGLAAASFGVAAEDVTAVGNALAGAFNVRCSPPTTIIAAQGAQLQEVCAAESCPYGPNGDSYCSDYPSPVPSPAVASAAMSGAASSAAPTEAPSSMASMASSMADSAMSMMSM